MRRWFGVVVFAVAVSTAAPAVSEVGPVFTYTPDHGPVGTTVRFAGYGCPDRGENVPADAPFGSTGDGRFILLYRNFSNSPQVTFDSDSAGRYSGSIVVRDPAPYLEGLGPEAQTRRTFPVAVQCYASGETTDWRNDGRTFTVTEPPELAMPPLSVESFGWMMTQIQSLAAQLPSQYAVLVDSVIHELRLFASGSAGLSNS